MPFLRWKEKISSHIDTLVGTDKSRKSAFLILVAVIIVQCIWIIALQGQLYFLSEQVHIQTTRIAQLEQNADKQNHQLYTDHLTISDIQKKWNDLNFRVLENTWKLNP